MSVKKALHEMHSRLGELEAAARKMPNHNFADIVKSAHGKLHQLMEHPDVDVVHKHLGEPADAKGPFPPG